MYQLTSAEHLQIAESFGDEYFGCTVKDNKSTFRVFCPRGMNVELEIFDTIDQEHGQRHSMDRQSTGVWETVIPKDLTGKLYGYRITPPNDGLPFEKHDGLVADPYAKWAICRNNHLQNPKTLIISDPDFDWDGDNFDTPGDPRDLVIYECHLQDLVKLCKSTEGLSTYDRFSHPDASFGISYLKKLGVNAIQLLPVHKIAYKEPPYGQTTDEGINNTWNPYSLNYWGYMTSFFFMPESLYAEASAPEENAVYGVTPDAINQFREIVRTCHAHGIAVLLDVVYNHVSQYDLNPLKLLDRMYYFRHDAEHRYTSESGCGNDFRSESPMARKLIVDSLLYWMEKFHIDGFRFDLAQLHDNETLQTIKEETRKLNPNVILIAEPWGGGYDPVRFSTLGWAAWNDQIRNGIKGSDPVHDPGLIFGIWQKETGRQSVENFTKGSLIGSPNGRFHKSSHSVNYLESHDGYTLGDFIRLAHNIELRNGGIKNKHDILALEGHELNSARLAAFILMISQGITMIHAGQEYARSKLIVESEINDPDIGKLDHNSYNKDNSTNYMVLEDVKFNQELFNYYSGLIKLRLKSPALRKADPDCIHFWSYEDPLHFTLSIIDTLGMDTYEYLISFNANSYREYEVNLPDGYWELMVTGGIASDQCISVIKGVVKVGPLSAVLLRKTID